MSPAKIASLGLLSLIAAGCAESPSEPPPTPVVIPPQPEANAPELKQFKTNVSGGDQIK